MGSSFFGLFQRQGPKGPLAGRYKVISELGAGGFGKTFFAEDLHLPGQPRCVVKQLKPQVSDAGSLQTARRLFDTEAKVLYQLGSHDQIPRLLAHFEDNQEFYLAQELIEGETLDKELVPGQPWSEVKTVALLQDILRALAFVHDQNVIHRDLKPSNLIRRQRDGKIVLIDFGAVKQVSTQLVNPSTGKTNLTVSIGTQGYMANEQLSGNPRFSSDVYSVGKIGIQALTGMYPRHLSEDAQTGEVVWRDRAPQASPALADILDRMVRYDFRARYPTATQALDALQALPVEILQSIPPQPSPEDATLLTSSDSPSTTAATVPVGGQEPTPISSEQTNSEPTEVAVPSTMPTVAVAAEPSSSPVEQPTAVAEQTVVQNILIKRWQIFAVLGVLGAAIVLVPLLGWVQSALRPQTANQSGANEESAVAESPSPTPEQQATELLNQAGSLREAKNYQAALDTYDEAIALNPEVAQAHWGRCFSLNQLRRAQEGIAACDRALELNPKYPKALWSKGTALEFLEKPGEALQLYDQAIALKPDFADAWNNRATALLRLNRPGEALAAADKAVELDPKIADAWANRGAALWFNGKREEAVNSIEQALKIDPNHANANSLYEDALQQLGRKRKKLKKQKKKKD